MTTSWTIASRDATAIRHSKRIEMKIAISPRKMASAQIAFLVIDHPHCDETDETLMSFTVTSAPSANACCNRVRTSSGWSSTCTLMIAPLSDERSWILALVASIPLSPRIPSASSTEKFSAGTSQATPPVKSSPRLSPLTLSDTTLITIIASDSPNHHQRRPQKSTAVSPRTRRRHLVAAISPGATGGCSVSTAVVDAS